MINLCSGWEFAENWSEELLSGGGETVPVRLPHTVKETPLHYAGPQHYEGVYGYRRALDLPESLRGRRLFLQFDGAAHIAEVFFNGVKCAEHRCGYTAFRAEITDYVNFGGDNTICVRLDCTENPAVPPFGFVIDYLTFGGKAGQPLVDAAFLAEGVLRAPTQIWGRLDDKTRKRLIDEWKRSREIKPGESNWLLFASTVEAALLEFSGEYDRERLYYGVNRFRNDWYKGDAWYGDGQDLHLDFYNSLVIHPMLTEVLGIIEKHGLEGAEFLPVQKKRLGRFAAELERMISPEGTYPVIGRSISYRFGSFHALADAAWLHLLSPDLSPAQVRCALTAVIDRQLAAKGTFDPEGWLRVGYSGRQVNMGETYINTGSLYLCTTAFLPLGLPADDPFWSAPARDWTSKKAWSGIDVGSDHAL